MNIIDIILIAVFGITLISGMQKGFFTSLLATIGFAAAWFVAISTCSTLAQQFMNSEFKVWLAQSIPFDSFLKDLSPSAIMSTFGSNDAIDAVAAKLMENGVSETVAAAFSTNAFDPAFVNYPLSQYISDVVWQSAFNVISFAIVFAIAYAVILLVVNLINNVFRFPKLRGADAILGGVFGLARGYAIVCLICAILPMLFTALSSDVIDTLLKDSSIGTFFLKSESVFTDLFKISDTIEQVAAKF